MGHAKLLVAIAILAVIVCAGLIGFAEHRGRSTNQTQTAATALFEFQHQWTANGNDLVFSRSRWPASVKALQMNRVEVSRLSAGISKREDGPFGLWWSEGYQIQRRQTNESRWTLYRTNAFGLPKKKGWRWRSVLTVITNAP